MSFCPTEYIKSILLVNLGEFFVVGMTRWAVYLLGSADKARNFSFKVRFTFPEGRRQELVPSMVFRSPCSAAPEDDAVKFLEHRCFYIHRRALEQYCQGDDDLNYGITVYESSIASENSKCVLSG